MSTDNRFDEPALNVAQKIMECRATAAVDGWPDVRLKAAIQCLVIEAMKWVAPALTVRGQVFIDGSVSDEAMKDLLAAVSAVPEGWKLVPIEPTAAMCDIGHVGVDVLTGVTDDSEYYSIDGQDAAKVYRAMLAAAPTQSPAAPGAWSDVVTERQRQIEKEGGEWWGVV